MKKKVLILLLGILSFVHIVSNAQGLQVQSEARKEQVKASKKELNERVSKSARKEAKRLSKEGWKSTPGMLPIDKQLDKSYMMQYEFGPDGYPKYIMAEAMSIGGNYDAAKMQAIELAKQNLAGLIQTEVSALIENTVANEQMNQADAVSITRSVMASKNLISQSLGRLIPVVEVYRAVNGNNKEVLVRVAYSLDVAKVTAKNALKKELEMRGDSMLKKLDTLLGW